MKRLSVTRLLVPSLALAILTCASSARASAISDKYALLGGASGFLGTPTIDESTTPDGVGRFRHYQHGSIYWSPDTGAHEVHGLIRQKWESLGWERSYLGYPMTDEIDTCNGAGRVSKFQGGELIWHRASNAVTEVKSTDLVIDLPLPEGQAWRVSQANAVDSGSHGGRWAYCFDFIRSSGWSDSNGKPFVAAASSEIVYVEDALGTGTGNNGNVIIQRLGIGRYASYLHNKKGSYSANFGNGLLLLPQFTPGAWPKPKSGTVLAAVGDTGTPEGAYHLHFCVTTSPDRDSFAPFESVPVAFQNFAVSTNSGGSWKTLSVGVPRRDQWVRREPAQAGQTSPRVSASSTIDFGKATGVVTLAAGTGKPSGAGKLTVSVNSPWGEALRTTTVNVPATNLNGPWPYTIDMVPAYNNLTIGVTYAGPWSTTTGGGPVGGQSAKFNLGANKIATQNVVIKASIIH